MSSSIYSQQRVCLYPNDVMDVLSRIERPSRPKFPPVKLGEAFHEPQFPMSKMERSVRSKILEGQQS